MPQDKIVETLSKMSHLVVFLKINILKSEGLCVEAMRNLTTALKEYPAFCPHKCFAFFLSHF